MLDNLRDEPSSSSFFDDDIPRFLEDEYPPEPPPRPFLGMTPIQRFFISVMLLITICLLGTMLLLVTGRFVLF